MDIRKQAELRRKKILANAEARLKKITGRLPESFDISKVPTEESLPEKNGNPCKGHGEFLSSTEDFSLEDSYLEHPDSYLNQIDEDSIQPKFTKPVPVKQKSRTFQYECCCFLALGIAIRLLFHMGLSWLCLDNILGPFLVAIIPRALGIYGECEPTGIYAFISLISAYFSEENQVKLSIFLKTVMTLRTILQFLALYMFSFIVTESILSGR